MKKGQKICSVTITKGIVVAKDAEGNDIKLTRTQRNLLSSVKSKTYIADIEKEWFKGVLDNNFTIMKDGKAIYIH